MQITDQQKINIEDRKAPRRTSTPIQGIYIIYIYIYIVCCLSKSIRFYSIHWSHWGLKKWLPYSRWHFHMYFSGPKCLPFDGNFSEVCKGSTDDRSALIQVMAWQLLGAKPLPEPMMSKLNKAIWFICHKEKYHFLINLNYASQSCVINVPISFVIIGSLRPSDTTDLRQHWFR